MVEELWEDIFKEKYSEWAGGELKYSIRGNMITVYGVNIPNYRVILPLMYFLTQPQDFIFDVCNRFKLERGKMKDAL